MLNKLSWGWVGFGGWPKQVIIKLTSASTGVRVEVGGELGKSLLAKGRLRVGRIVLLIFLTTKISENFRNGKQRKKVKQIF